MAELPLFPFLRKTSLLNAYVPCAVNIIINLLFDQLKQFQPFSFSESKGMTDMYILAVTNGHSEVFDFSVGRGTQRYLNPQVFKKGY